MNIKPDIELINFIKKDSGSSLKSCFQCGACSVVCELSPDNKPFPRKEMIWASWGLKEKLLGDPDIWLCHQCGDCSTHCPRGVKPGDVFSSLRHMTYLHYAKPKFFATLLSNPKYLPVVLGIPVAFILLVIFMAGTLRIPEGNVNFSKFFPHLYLNISFTFLLFLVIISMIWSMKKFWKDLSRQIPVPGKKNSLIKSFIQAVSEVFSHRKFRTCSSQSYRFFAHFIVFWGFIFLLVLTIFAIISTIFFHYPFSFWNPVKILGNIAGIMLFAGCSILIYKRIVDKNSAGHSNYFDWVFLISFYILTISGVATEIARFQNSISAYYIYFFHLVFVFLTIIYAPYTKFGHFIYRTVAIIFSKYIGRDT